MMNEMTRTETDARFCVFNVNGWNKRGAIANGSFTVHSSRLSDCLNAIKLLFRQEKFLVH